MGACNCFLAFLFFDIFVTRPIGFTISALAGIKPFGFAAIVPIAGIV